MTSLVDWIRLLIVSKSCLVSLARKHTIDIAYVPHHRLNASSKKYSCCGVNGGRKRRLGGPQYISQQQSTSPSTAPKNVWNSPRLYVDSTRLAENSVVRLSPEQTHYLTKVMRILKKSKQSDTVHNEAEKDFVRLFNGVDGEWLAKVIVSSGLGDDTKQGKRRQHSRQNTQLEVQCVNQIRNQSANDEDRPWVLSVPTKSQPRMKMMIEKCTELGVGSIILVRSDRMDSGAFACSGSGESQEKLDSENGGCGLLREGGSSGKMLEKLVIQAIESSEQSERLSIPQIKVKIPSIDVVNPNFKEKVWTVRDCVRQWCSNWDESNGKRRKLLICRERAERNTQIVPILDAIRSNDRPVAFVIGPEGGWSSGEETLFDEICSQYRRSTEPPIQCVSIGSSVLRAETACMMTVGAWSLLNG